MINGMALAQDPPAHVKVHGNVYGGGNKAVVMGSSSVLMNKSNSDTILGDVYGGGALAHVNATMTVSGSDTTYTYNEGTATHVTILQGVINGNVYGGGLGDSISYGGSADIAALVYGKVFVNIGNNSGGPTLKSSVFGCNNINGTPLDSVFVNIYKTAHTTGEHNNQYPAGIDTYDELESSFPADLNDPNYAKEFAIKAVYGGGNKASYKPNLNGNGDPKCTTVHVFECDENTIQTIYGGGNAADVGTSVKPADTRLIIEGGRYDQVFGGGNGYSATHNHFHSDQSNYNPGANIFGTALTDVQGGLYRQVFGGSNQYGNIATVSLGIDNQCDVLLIYESFGGANEANISGNINTTLYCNNKDYKIGNFYGGSNLADIDGSVTLNILGGQYHNIFGGSKGTLPAPGATQEQIAAASADISGAVTLNLHGGTMENAFGGSDVFGSILGAINVNVWDTVAYCQLQVDTVYGGGRDAAYTPSLVNGEKIVSPIVNLWNGTVGHGSVNGCVFGGGKGSGAVVTAHPKVMIGDTLSGLEHENNQITIYYNDSHYGNIFGGGNAAQVDGIDSVLMLKGNSRVGNLFGGGNAAEADSAVVIMNVVTTVDTIFGGGNLAGLTGSALVTVTNGTVRGGIYGGSNKSGTVDGDITVNVTGSSDNHTTIGANDAHANLHGGGYGQDTQTKGHVTVNYGDTPATFSEYPKVYGDIYGGSALGWVNDATDGGIDTTTVNILNGNVYGNVYGGGLGRKQGDIKAGVNGKVFVNIGTIDNNSPVGNVVFSDTSAVFGCNNLNGSPQDSVFVNVYSTHHGNTPETNAYPTSISTLGALATNSTTQAYALQSVYGGGNEASYTPTLANGEPRSTTVHVFNCQSNTIKEVYGGGNAANVGTTGSSGVSANTFVIIEGGRINRVFGGGKGVVGEVAANIYGTATTTIYAGLIDTIFGGSNQNGSISDAHLVLATESGSCEKLYNQVFGGANVAEIAGNVNTTINCGVGTIGDIYGGSNLANITGSGNVTLNIKGGTYNNVFGGSRGSSSNGADISGNVELNLEGGTMSNAFGGSNVKGNIAGKITVNVEDTGSCPLVVDTIYGGGQKADYTPNLVAGKKIVSPVVNLLNGTVGEEDGSHVVTVPGCVFGGGKEASVTANPKVVIGDTTAAHSTYQARVLGNVFGGGNLATVDGIDSVLMIKSNSQAVNLFGGGNMANADSTVVWMTEGAIDTIFGGGNLAGLGGTAKVVVDGGTVLTGLYGGCNTSGNVGGNVTVNVTGGTIGATGTGNEANVHGGGFGNGTSTSGDVNVTINGASATIWGDVYGGSAKGHVNDAASNKTNVTLTAGTIHGDLYGGGLGDDTYAAAVNGAVLVKVNGGTVNDVFGCNNVNGAPQSTVRVDIEQTGSNMSVNNVFGGGNLAVYSGNPKVFINNGTVSGNVYGGGNGDPADNTQTKGSTGVPTVTVGDLTNDNYQAIVLGDVYGGGNAAKVTGTNVADSIYVQKCNTQINYVYGGGNAANVPATFVKVMGGTIDTIFGGGHGDNTLGHLVAANVNGNDTISITGGTIKKVFAGSNLNGSITGRMALNIDKGSNGCDMKIGEAYGGGNMAAGKAGAITIGCTGDWTTTGTNNHTNHNSTTNRIGYELEGIGTVYGGANKADIGTSENHSNIVLKINSGIVENVFGGNNTSGVINGTIQVNINKTSDACGWYVGDVYGGGNYAAYGGIPDVNIIAGTVSHNVYGGGNQAGVGGGDVAMTGGSVLGGIYGGCNTSGEVGGDITVDITGGTIGSADSLSSPRYITADVFGGGYGSATSTSGNVEVNINGSDVNIYGDVYGGSALGNVNKKEATDKTTVNILEGILHSEEETIGGFIVYHGGNVYGGGLGRKDDPSTSGVDEAVEAKVYGEVTVNIGEISGTGATGGDQTGNSYSGNATIGGSVYGCNNTNGSPQQDVTVNIYATAHTDGNGGTPNNTFDGNAYAIANVFGGGNEAHYTPSVVKKKATVNIFGCDNTIGRTFGGGNAAHVGTTTVNASVETDILGGRIGQVFGGGNGERGSAYAANIYGNDTLKIHGGSIGQSFGGSNQNGTIFGAIDITVDENGCGSMEIDEFFCGGNFVDIIGGLTSTISCAGSMHVNNLYGGCNMADIYGDVELNLYGGEYINVFGGSKGDLVSLGGNHINKAANIKKYPSDWETNSTYPAALQTYMSSNGGDALVGQGGNVTLNLYGGTMTNAYGGSNVNGNIEGVITVNLLDAGSTQCPLQVDTIYGSGCDAAYTPVDVTTGVKPVSPIVNIKHGTVGHEGTSGNSDVAGCVFGGGKGTTATVTANPKVIIGDEDNSHIATVRGNVFGGGNAAPVVGVDTVLIQKASSTAVNLFGGGNAASAGSSVVMMEQGTIDTIFGGGNLAGLTGTSKIVMTNGTVHKGIFGGCNASGSVNGVVTLEVNGGAVGADNALAYGIYGGGYGAETSTGDAVNVTIGNSEATPTIYGDIYGGSAKGNVNAGTSNLTKVWVKKGNIHGDIYGGGFGDGGANALVKGNVAVLFDGGTLFTVTNGGGRVFGCNNLNGTPQGTVTVTVNTTNPSTTSGETKVYALKGVYGGGNQANYVPTDDDNGYPRVIIGCNTSIEDVFGGANAAAVPQTDVTINGGDLKRVFAGGNGTSGSAHVGYNTKVTPVAGDDYGLGTASAHIKGGTILEVFGGSNSSGLIRANGALLVAKDGDCEMHIGDVYGGGNLADGAPATLNIGCTGGETEGINNVYGGANNAAVTGDIELNIVGGRINNVYGGNNNGGVISGTITVNVEWDNDLNCGTNGKYLGNVYGGGNLAAYSSPMTTGENPVHTNYPEVNILNGTISQNVFGAGKGDGATVTGRPTVTIGDLTKVYQAVVNGNVYGGGDLAEVSGSTSVTIQKNNGTGAVTSVGHDVYGGGNKANVSGSSLVDVTGGSVTQDVYGGGALANVGTSASDSTVVTIAGGTMRDVYGGGLGQTTPPSIEAKVYGKVKVKAMGGNITNMFGCNNLNGAPQSTVQVIVNDTTAAHSMSVANVYGGGNLAAYTGTPDVDIVNGTVSNCVYGGGNQAGVGGGDVVMTGGTVRGGLYGGCNTSGNVGGNVTVNVTGGTIGATGTGNEANVHGGGFGNGTSTSGDVNVTINGASATIWGDVYGGSAKGHVNDAASNKTNVTLTAGTIHGDLYGGGLGDNTYAALVNGAVQVTVNGGSVTGSVYGCNNANGAPQSTVKVDIYGTDTPASGYALGNVFGGGNLAGYPGTPEVTIHNCNNSIEFVYGGGNAAPVAATNVKVYGGNTIGNVFGGGNGTGVAADFVMVTGNVLANIYGGTIGKVFGGNNSSGLINGTVTLNVNKETETGHSSCDMKINEVYGGGNMAAGNAGTINIGCTGDLVTLGSGEHYGIDQEGIRYVYGGANQAGINNDIVLNINSGIVENVFGGNNTSGTIAGSIKVNINKDNGASCFSDWYVGNVYGGGNLAKYTAPTSGSYTGKYPEVNILNGLVSGDVFGGGLGQTGDAGQVTGDPQVTVNGTDASVNGSVYGGGSLAPTKGNPLVTLTTGTVTKVFGGGKAADVDGTPTVDINGGQVNTGVYGGCDSQGDVKGKITVNVKNGTLGSAANLALATPVTVDVYGGGYGSATTTSGDVEVNIGECTSTNTHNDFPKIYGDVYGGSALGKVNGSNANTTIVNVLNGRLYTFAESATTANGQTYYKYHGGNVYGGGLGDRVGLGTGHSNVLAEENGKIIVNIGASGGSRALAPDTNIGEAIIDGNVYGCNNTNGSPQDDVTVNIYRTHREETDIITYTGPLTPTFALNDVFGGGNQADYNPTATGKKSTVMIHGCHNTIQRVFGGSNAAASGSSSVPVEVNANINGGRFYNVFGGGNGEVSAANIYGDVKLEIHGGIVDEFFVGSNQEGSISGSSNVTVDQSSGCDEITITEFYCGGKYADYIGNINAEISCSQGLNVNYLYGGCKEAHVIGNVHLTVKGGTYDYIFGGSRGTTTKGADIQGDVVLDVYGGTVNNAIFGGSNVKGAIGGTITVNVEDKFPNDDCALEVSTADVYGGGNQADYPGTASAGSPLSGTITHTPPYNYPAVNIKNATVKNVFGGGLEADVIGNPQILIKKGSKIRGNVYGGGNMGEVIGDPKVIINGKLE